METGYPAYTTTPGWLGYDDDKLVRLSREAVADGFELIKLKVGASLDDDLRRLALARETVGPDIRIAIDANQRWDVDEATAWVTRLSEFDPYWIEEPTSPDDILGHAVIRTKVAPVRVATGEHAHNRVMFKQLLQAGAIDVVQIDASRVAGVNENLAILLLAAKFGVPVCPHAGGVGLCEVVRHLSMFDFVAITGTHAGPVHRVRRPPARALRRPGRRHRRSLPRPDGARHQRGDAPEVRPRPPVPRRPGLEGRVMLAAQYVAGRGIEVAEVEPRPPGPGEVQLEVAYVGICGTDLHILAGHMDDRIADHGVIGHEMSGRVAAVGDGVTEWASGDAVTVMPLRWCGRCPTCRAGHTHICDRLDFVGIDSTGAMQQLWNVPQQLLVPLPADLSLRAAALVEPVAVARHDVVRASLSADEPVLVIGGGPIGVLIAVIARARGAKALLVEPDPYRRSVAEGLGLDVLDSGAASLPAWLEAWSEAAGAAVTFEVSGTQAGLDLAVAALGARGRLVAVGIHAEPRQVDMKRVFWKELQILGARVYDRSDFTAAIELLVQDAIPVDALVSTTAALAEAPGRSTASPRGVG